MLCPRCKGNTEVNRTLDLDFSVERNRHCLNCGRYFNTVEILKHEYDTFVSTQPGAQKLLFWS